MSSIEILLIYLNDAHGFYKTFIVVVPSYILDVGETDIILLYCLERYIGKKYHYADNSHLVSIFVYK